MKYEEGVPRLELKLRSKFAAEFKAQFSIAKSSPKLSLLRVNKISIKPPKLIPALKTALRCIKMPKLI